MRHKGFTCLSVKVIIWVISSCLLSVPAVFSEDKSDPQLFEVPELKKLDPSRIGSEASYATFGGWRMGSYFPIKYFSIAQRVEIYQEPRPIDSYILDAKKARWVNTNQPWNQKGQFRSQVIPIFTRAYGTEITMSDPKSPEAILKYTHDYRDIYGNQFPIYLADSLDVNYKHESWDQNEVLLMHAKQIPGINWFYSSNFGYRYSTMNAKNDQSTHAYYENRHTYFVYGSLAPSERLEFFGQFEYFKSKRAHSTFTYSPDHWFYATELRMKSKDLKTSFIPRFSYSIDKYYPFYNRYSKYETQVKIGHDFNERLSMASTVKYNLGIRNDVDNTAPNYDKPNPINEVAAWAGIENRAQYQIIKRLWLQGGIDYGAGTNMSDFDNWGWLAGLEYYAPGLIRVDVGVRGNQYYNIDDNLTCVYFKFFLFM